MIARMSRSPTAPAKLSSGLFEWRNNEVAKSLKEFLGADGHRSLFLDFDPADGIPAGRDWERELYQRIRNCQAMIVICMDKGARDTVCGP